MQSYPLYFTFKMVIQGDDFRALVGAKGKALMTKEDGKWWVYGVQPGGLAASGTTRQESLDNFQNTFKNVLLDTASATSSASIFEKETRSFFDCVEKEELKVWQAAREDIRSEKQVCPNDINRLVKETSNPPCRIDIILIRKKKPLPVSRNDIISEAGYRCAA